MTNLPNRKRGEAEAGPGFVNMPQSLSVLLLCGLEGHLLSFFLFFFFNFVLAVLGLCCYARVSLAVVCGLLLLHGTGSRAHRLQYLWLTVYLLCGMWDLSS